MKKRFFRFPKRSEPLGGKEKRPGGQADFSLPYKAKFKNESIYYLTTICHHCVHRGNFTLIFLIIFNSVKVRLHWFPATIVGKK